MKNRTPAESFPPGEFLRDELDARGWSQTDLAEIIGRGVTVVNEIISGKRGITADTAQGLADAFGISAQFWLNLESMYRLSLVGQRDDTISRRARLYEKAPVRDMVRRGWIEDSRDIETLRARVLKSSWALPSSIKADVPMPHGNLRHTQTFLPPKSRGYAVRDSWPRPRRAARTRGSECQS